MFYYYHYCLKKFVILSSKCKYSLVYFILSYFIIFFKFVYVWRKNLQGGRAMQLS